MTEHYCILSFVYLVYNALIFTLLITKATPIACLCVLTTKLLSKSMADVKLQPISNMLLDWKIS